MKTKIRNALCGLLSGLLLLAASAAPVSAQVNLVQNGSFESGGTGWFLGGAVVSTDSAQDGSTSLRITSPIIGPLLLNPARQDIITQIGVNYTVSVWIRTVGVSGATAVFDTNDRYDSLPAGNCQFTVGPPTRGTTDWTKYTGTFTATRTSVRLRVFPSNMSFLGFAYFDNVSVVQGIAPTVSLPGPATIGCTSVAGAAASVMVTVGDRDNDPLTVTWSVNNVVVATHSLAAGATSDTLLNQPFGFGVNTVSVSVSDGKAPPVTGGTTVTVTAHDAPVPQVATLPTLTGECAGSITVAPLADDPCAEGGVVAGTTSLGPLPLNFTAQGTYTVTWTYTSPHDGMLSTAQEQTVIVKDVTPPTISCPANVSVAYGSVPAAATTVAEFLAQGGTIEDNCDPNGTVTSYDSVEGFCPTVITRSYVVRDAVGNPSSCEQIITVNNLFAEDGIVWHQPLARSGMSEDTDPSAGNTLKYRFKLGSTIPIQVHAQGCSGAVTANANVTGKVVVFGDTDMDGVVDANETPIDILYNGVGEAGGVMDKIDSHLKYNLNTKSLPPTFKCYILHVTVTDTSTGESNVEIVPLQAK